MVEWRLKLKKAVHDSWVWQVLFQKTDLKSINSQKEQSITAMGKWSPAERELLASSLTSHKKSMAKEEKWAGTDAGLG